MARTQLARSSSKTAKQSRGRVPIGRTPIEIRSKQRLGNGFQAHLRSAVATHAAAAGDALERTTVRFEDINGPKGGVDTECRIQLSIAGRPPIVVAKRAASAEEAFAAAVKAVG